MVPGAIPLLKSQRLKRLLINVSKRVAIVNEFENLPTETIEYHLSDEDQVCSCCGGTLHKMSTEVRKELKIIPAQVKVTEHIPVFLGSLASPSAMAYR
ncbi:IS66 family transposase zinc-finger binding domain-containing protein [Ornithinibacillus xuwenensis]|uniref:IS66 family transposase zinc-finger binding domain-containing protein n=1 Tax=Ornithinibacillus xuwenensis TaxID=3144668 RepID=UPI003D002C4B